MLEPLPSRNVTRFLLPLADVMALLFSLFLLLPHLEQQPGRLTAQAVQPGSYWAPDEQRHVREELDRLRRLVQLPANERLYLVVLDIDGHTGNLLVPGGSKADTLTIQEDVDRMVAKHLGAARAGDKELLYILRLPPHDRDKVRSSPSYQQLEQFRQWFTKWNVSYQIPGLIIRGYGG
jgi:hypothetical protein